VELITTEGVNVSSEQVLAFDSIIMRACLCLIEIIGCQQSHIASLVISIV